MSVSGKMSVSFSGFFDDEQEIKKNNPKMAKNTLKWIAKDAQDKRYRNAAEAREKTEIPLTAAEL